MTGIFHSFAKDINGLRLSIVAFVASTIIDFPQFLRDLTFVTTACEVFKESPSTISASLPRSEIEELFPLAGKPHKSISSVIIQNSDLDLTKDDFRNLRFLFRKSI